MVQVRVVQLPGLKMTAIPVALVQVDRRHDRPNGLLHVPGVGEQPEAELQDWPLGSRRCRSRSGSRRRGTAAKGELLQVPFMSEQVVAGVQDWPKGELLHVPFWSLQSVFTVQAGTAPTVQ